MELVQQQLLLVTIQRGFITNRPGSPTAGAFYSIRQHDLAPRKSMQPPERKKLTIGFIVATIILAIETAVLYRENTSLEQRLAERDTLVAELQWRGSRSPKQHPDNSDPTLGMTSPSASVADSAAAAGNLAAKPENTIEVNHLRAIQENGRVEQTYGALFKHWTLTSTQQTEVQQILVERQLMISDVASTMRSQGKIPSGAEGRRALGELTSQIRDEYSRKLHTVIGKEKHSEFLIYERTLPERNTVTVLTHRLEMIGFPMKESQIEQLIGIMSKPEKAEGRLFLIQDGMVFAGLNEEILGKSEKILNPEQIKTLVTLQHEQDARRRLSEIARRNAQTKSGSAATSP